MWRLSQIGAEKSVLLLGVPRASLARLPLLQLHEIQEEFQQSDLMGARRHSGLSTHGMSMEWADVVPGKYMVQRVDTKTCPRRPAPYAFRFPA